MAAEGLALDYEVIATVALLDTAGTFIGAYIAKRLPKDKLRRGFGVFLIVMGLYILAMSGSELMA